MKKVLLVAALLAAASAAFLYAGTGSHEAVITEVKEDVRDTSRALAIKGALVRHFGRDAMDIRVVVDESAVSLSGDVRQRPTMELSEEVVRSLDSAYIVHNFLSHAPSDVESATDLFTHAEMETGDAILETKIKHELISGIGDAAFAVSVEACDGVVSLRGQVPDQERRDVAIRSVGGHPDVMKVIDLLTVAS